eukprot:g2151.t1
MSFFSTFEFPEGEGPADGEIVEGEAHMDLLAGAIGGMDIEVEGKEAADEDEGAMDLASALASVRAEAKEDGGGVGKRASDDSSITFDRPVAPAPREAKESKDERAARVERQKSSSTSTVYLKSTIAVPDVEKILLGVSALLDKMVVECEDPSKDPFVMCLPSRTRAALQHMPAAPITVETIFVFMKKAFKIAQWSPESNVIAMVLLTRLTGSTDVTINDRNWEKLLLSAFLLAQKLWDDTPLANVDFPLLWSQINGVEADFDLRAVNRMEKLFLSKLHFDIHVDRSTYTQFYFELYALTGGDGRSGLKPISERAAVALEANSASAQRQLDQARGTWGGADGGGGGGGGGGGHAAARREAKGEGGGAIGSATVALGGAMGAYKSKGGRMVLD